MKLPIKKKWFDRIKSGRKTIEIRDAHITFVCEETGETIRKNITHVSLSAYNNFGNFGITEEEAKEMFEDDLQIRFHIR